MKELYEMKVQQLLNTLKNGDLLFVPDTNDDLSQMIAKSTVSEIEVQFNAHKNYTHVGILERSLAGFFVLHATPAKGCIRETLTDFLIEQQSLDVYRLKRSTANHESAIRRGKKLLGEPYNDSFIAEQPGYYCSEFVCALYPNLFAQIPMSFGSGGSILPEWISYYKKLNLPIPNGLPGSSPNSLLKQDITVFITTLYRE